MIKIYGSSDDLIEVEGNVNEEFGHYSDEPAMLGCSDGTLIRVRHDEEGIWRLTIIRSGKDTTYDLRLGQDDRQHTDVLTLHADVNWVVYTTGNLVYALAKPQPGEPTDA